MAQEPCILTLDQGVEFQLPATDQGPAQLSAPNDDEGNEPNDDDNDYEQEDEDEIDEDDHDGEAADSASAQQQASQSRLHDISQVPFRAKQTQQAGETLSIADCQRRIDLLDAQRAEYVRRIKELQAANPGFYAPGPVQP